MRRSPESWRIRFWNRVWVRSKDECWPWIGYKVSKDPRHAYGQVNRPGGRRDLAHRVSYEIHVGPIPEGHQVLHTCENGACVNPRHLFAAEPRVKAVRTYKQGKAPHLIMRGEKNPHHKLTEDDVRTIRRLYADGGWTHRGLGKKFGVDHSIIGDIVKRKTWKSVG